ncbi:MAG: hypothetical protein V7754_23345 [Halioglobus sp.]
MMTEYELADLEFSKTELLLHTIEMTDGNIEIFGVYLFGYLLVAYFIGATLSRPQVIVLNVIYVLFTGYQLLRVFGGILLSDLHEGDLLELLEQRHGVAYPSLDIVNFEWAATITILHVFAVIASLYFMWSVRHPKAE